MNNQNKKEPKIHKFNLICDSCGAEFVQELYEDEIKSIKKGDKIFLKCPSCKEELELETSDLKNIVAEPEEDKTLTLRIIIPSIFVLFGIYSNSVNTIILTLMGATFGWLTVKHARKNHLDQFWAYYIGFLFGLIGYLIYSTIGTNYFPNKKRSKIFDVIKIIIYSLTGLILLFQIFMFIMFYSV